MHTAIKIAAGALASLAVVSALASPARARQSSSTRGVTGSTSGPPVRGEPIRRELDRELERESLLRSMEADLNRPARRADQHLALEQIEKDFTRIQVVNNELKLSASRGGELDFKFVTKSATEIRKLAERLRSNLALPDPDSAPRSFKAEDFADEARLRSSLPVLGELIFGFAHNRVFTESNVVDAQLSAKARRDLEEIIELSGELKKAGERLTKASTKSR